MGLSLFYIGDKIILDISHNMIFIIIEAKIFWNRTFFIISKKNTDSNGYDYCASLLYYWHVTIGLMSEQWILLTHNNSTIWYSVQWGTFLVTAVKQGQLWSPRTHIPIKDFSLINFPNEDVLF